ncbi:ABC transporter transmembrane domain-containing protein [Dokdonella sp.]|uniref:ABC transporter transmembrane domain-containing protein n=1 Tax=Dokdonella sp. TaxID=2291710 RepID=UPI001B2132AE|nr:ABC transporter transmembrane domain-containing protein [Dokdonella sp.]MBO9663460.1 ATP-binding cassette domain-containing protein [Dokdonella sp.]
MTRAATTEKSAEAPRRLRSFTRLLPYLKPYRGLIAGWLGFLALSSAATLTLPQAVRVMIDRGFSEANAAAINASFLGLFGVAAVLAIATAARFFFVSLLGERVAADLRRRLYDHLLTLDQAFFERTRSGELVSRLAADTELVQTVVGSTLSVAVRSLVTLIGGAVAMVATSPRLAGFTALVIPAVILPIVVFGRRVSRLSRESQDRIADTSATASEALNAMHTVQAYTREPQESARYAGAVARALATAKKRIAMTGTLTALVILLTFGAITAVLWAGAQAVIGGSMAAGVLGQFVLYAVLVAGSVGALTEVWGEILRAAGALGRIGELLDTQAEIRTPAAPHALPQPVRGAIRFDGVEFRYPSRPDRAALHDFTLAVEPGQTVALVGPSGAGKSTVFQLLLRFHDPQSGRITLDGVDLAALALPDLRGAFALVPQDPVLFGASAADNIGFGRSDATREQILAAARAAEAHDFLDALPERYDTYLGERGVRLSGGQQQRVAIARALLRDAPVLLLDEATSSLDAQSEHLVQQALERLMHGRTTLVIAHRLATVQRADRIVVMDAGRIVAQGTHAELVREGGLYAELARLQFAT